MNIKIDKIKSLLAKFCSRFKWQFIEYGCFQIKRIRDTFK